MNEQHTTYMITTWTGMYLDTKLNGLTFPRRRTDAQIEAKSGTFHFSGRSADMPNAMPICADCRSTADRLIPIPQRSSVPSPDPVLSVVPGRCVARVISRRSGGHILGTEPEPSAHRQSRARRKNTSAGADVRIRNPLAPVRSTARIADGGRAA